MAKQSGPVIISLNELPRPAAMNREVQEYKKFFEKNGYPFHIKEKFDQLFPSSTSGYRKAMYELIVGIVEAQKGFHEWEIPE